MRLTSLAKDLEGKVIFGWGSNEKRRASKGVGVLLSRDLLLFSNYNVALSLQYEILIKCIILFVIKNNV